MGILRDIAQLAKLGLLTMATWATPPRYWPRLARRLADPIGGESDPDLPLYERVLGIDPGSPRAREIYVGRRFWRRLVQLQALGLIGPWRRWRPSVELVGRRHLDQALGCGRGVVLWLSEWACSEIVAKVALVEAGYRATQLSRPEHGFGATPLLVRFMNPLWMRMEDRFLHGRVAISGEHAGEALRSLRARLAGNEVVIITVGSRARRLVEVPFLGDRLQLPTGPAHLAATSGAAILPVFPEALEDGSFRLTIDPPLALPASGGGLGAVAAEYAHRLEPYVRERPEQWRGWHNLVPREVAPTPVYAAAAGG